ncbi:MAG: hypothetical protein HYX27_03090 [Acidobacteria bacterium]|nr:hypothetical protein [Acidobacteriota bacterium]
MRIRRTLLLVVIALIVWSTLYGPLLPWSPVHPGYAEVAGERVSIVYPQEMALPDALRKPDALLAEAEQFHRLYAGRRVKIFICADWAVAYRVLPRLARRGVGAITLATGNAIYVLPTVQEKGLDHVEFVRHELSHAVLNQNQSIRNALRITEVQWLAEGIAVWFGRQKAYVTDEDFLRGAEKRNLAALIDPDRRGEIAGPFDIRYGYVCWKHFNVYLESQGPDRYWGYVHAVIQEPLQWRSLFERHFQQKLDDAITAFAQQVRKEAAALPALADGPASAPRTRSNQ